MSSSGQASGAPVTFSIRLPAESHKKYSVLKFNAANNVDFTKCGTAKIGRENNLSDFKSAYDIETMPKFGAGSEYGREQREEARKKKFGMRIKKYNSDEQPWLLNLGRGEGNPPRRFKGTREGGISENASFYIFMQCADGKTFEAYPIDEWYSFAPQVKYRYLDIEEAEDEYNKRDKTLNYFNIMLRKRLKNDEDGAGKLEEGESSKKKSSKADKSLLISEFDEMSQSSDDDVDDDSGKETKDDEEKRDKKPKKQKVESKKEAKKSKKDAGSDDEPMEESDDLDEGEEVDYISGSSSDDEQMYDDKGRDESDKYQDKGVEDEEGLKKLVDSGDEEEEDEDKKEDEMEDDDESRLKDDKAKGGSDSSDSSSDSDSDSDPEKDNKFASALFMTDRRTAIKPESSGSRPSTPSSQQSSSDHSSKVKKRKAENQSPVTVAKKPKSETLVTSGSSSSLSLTAAAGSSGASSEGITEEAVRRYLMRKPMTTKDLVQKFKSRNAGMTKEQMTTTIAQILKRINPQKTKINDKLYLSIKKDS